MSIDFQQALAAAMQQQNNNNTNTGKKTAEYWCNIGVHINDEQFVSIGGFPLDTITANDLIRPGILPETRSSDASASP